MPKASLNCMGLGQVHRSKAISSLIFSWVRPHKKKLHPPGGCGGCLKRNFGSQGEVRISLPALSRAPTLAVRSSFFHRRFQLMFSLTSCSLSALSTRLFLALWRVEGSRRVVQQEISQNRGNKRGRKKKNPKRLRTLIRQTCLGAHTLKTQTPSQMHMHFHVMRFSHTNRIFICSLSDLFSCCLPVLSSSDLSLFHPSFIGRLPLVFPSQKA